VPDPVSREQAILEAAERLFAERSFDGVGLALIGKEAGIVASGVYRHFGSKQEILATLIDRASDAVLEYLAEPDPDPVSELHNLVSAHVEFCIKRSRLADIWQREHYILQNEHAQHFTRRQQRYIERWLACLDQCYPGHRREVLTAAIRGAHALISSDTTRRSGSRQAPELPRLLTTLTLASLEGLRSF